MRIYVEVVHYANSKLRSIRVGNLINNIIRIIRRRLLPIYVIQYVNVCLNIFKGTITFIYKHSTVAKQVFTDPVQLINDCTRYVDWSDQHSLRGHVCTTETSMIENDTNRCLIGEGDLQ